MKFGLPVFVWGGCRSIRSRLYLVSSCIVLTTIFAPLPCSAQSARESSAHFEQEIRPLLVDKCLSCHGAKKQEGNLRLDSWDALLRGGDSGPVIDANDPAKSLLLEAVGYQSFEMPPDGQLPKRSIRQFEKWAANGFLWPREVDFLREEGGKITAEDRQWWAFQELRKPSLPSADPSWSTHPIDRFVWAELQKKNMQPAAQASPETLIRRLYFDLIGLPPSPAEMDEFFADKSPDAWERLVDKLLDDPRYGEHWARYWLDLVRYSESDGWNQDAYRPHIWRYRDYVIDSWNSDKPYPQFVREQLAGDELGGDDPAHLVATGFLRLGIYEYNQRDARGHWNDIMNEMTDVAGDVFFGLSMACARCHDHKFDPIPQRDYFKLRAFFEPLVWRDDLVAATPAEHAKHADQLRDWEKRTESIQQQIDRLLDPYYTRKWASTVDKFPLDIQACFHMPVSERTSWQDQMAYLVSRQFMEEGGGPLKDMEAADKTRHEELQKALEAFDEFKPNPLPTIMAATDFSGLHSPTLIPDAAERVVIEPGFLAVMQSENEAGGEYQPTTLTRPNSAAARTQEQTSGKRSALAAWIGSAHNPLTTRVIVNRIWQQHFGKGLVTTPSDFGTQGQLPSHPDLLDWLTTNFIEDGWSFKKLHRQIVTSRTWQQSSLHDQAVAYARLDPGEQYLWRWPVQRLRAEQIRDAMLSASGELDHKQGGPGVEEATPRRALYVKSFRNKNDTFMHGFDIANGLKSVPQRDTTTTPTQALLLINGEYALGRAKAMAQRLSTTSPDPIEQIQLAFLTVWGRQPTPDETRQAMEYLEVLPGEDAAPINEDRLSDFCHILFNSNQFLYVE